MIDRVNWKLTFWEKAAIVLWHRPKYIIESFLHKIRYGFQRMFRGYDDRYVFNFDTEFISNIHKILKDFKKNTVGYPAYMNSADEWQDILESMITKLETIQELQYEEGITEELEKYEELEKVKNEFFVLFSKYFFSLWY